MPISGALYSTAAAACLIVIHVAENIPIHQPNIVPYTDSKSRHTILLYRTRTFSIWKGLRRSRSFVCVSLQRVWVVLVIHFHFQRTVTRAQSHFTLTYRDTDPPPPPFGGTSNGMEEARETEPAIRTIEKAAAVGRASGAAQRRHTRSSSGLSSA